MPRVASNSAYAKRTRSLICSRVPSDKLAKSSRCPARVSPAIDDDFVHYELKPEFKVMGPKYGPKMKAIAAELGKARGQQVCGDH